MKFLLICMSAMFLMACHHHGVKSGSCKRGQKTCWLKKADANQDGQISRDEFSGFHKAKFDRMDANGDNMISTEERKAAYKKWKSKRSSKTKKSCPFSKKSACCKSKKSCPLTKKSKCCQKSKSGQDCSNCPQDACAKCGKSGEERKNCTQCAGSNR